MLDGVFVDSYALKPLIGSCAIVLAAVVACDSREPSSAPESTSAPHAVQLHRKGAGLFEVGDYEGALRNFRAAYMLADPETKPALAYNVGITAEKLGECEIGIAAYEQFRAGDPRNDAAADEGLARLEALGCLRPNSASPQGAPPFHGVPPTAATAEATSTAKSSETPSPAEPPASPPERTTPLPPNADKYRIAKRIASVREFCLDEIAKSEGAFGINACDTSRLPNLGTSAPWGTLRLALLDFDEWSDHAIIFETTDAVFVLTGIGGEQTAIEVVEELRGVEFTPMPNGQVALVRQMHIETRGAPGDDPDAPPYEWGWTERDVEDRWVCGPVGPEFGCLPPNK